MTRSCSPARARCARATASPSWRPRARSPREDFEAGADQLRTLGFEPVVIARVVRPAPATSPAPARRRHGRACATRWPTRRSPAVIATRGGYGSGAAAAIPRLRRASVPRAKLHRLQRHHRAARRSYAGLRLVAFHGPMAEGRLARGAGAYDRDSFLRIVMRAVPLGECRGPAGSRRCSRARRVACCVGGTLTQLAASLGHAVRVRPPPSRRPVPRRGDERPYRLDRLLTQLRAAGMFDTVTASSSNELPGCDEPGGQRHGARRRAPRAAGFPGPVAGRRADRPHRRRDAHAAVRRAGHASDGAATRRSSSTKRRSWPDEELRRAHSSDWRLRHGDGHACRHAARAGPRRHGFRPASIRR